MNLHVDYITMICMQLCALDTVLLTVLRTLAGADKYFSIGRSLLTTLH